MKKRINPKALNKKESKVLGKGSYAFLLTAVWKKSFHRVTVNSLFYTLKYVFGQKKTKHNVLGLNFAPRVGLEPATS